MQVPENTNQKKIDKLIKALGIDLEFTGKEIAEIIWLALKRQELIQTVNLSDIQTDIENEDDNSSLSGSTIEIESDKNPIEHPPTTTSIYADLPRNKEQKGYSGNIFPLRVPDAPSIREPLEFAKALRPLMRKMDSGRNTILDEIETVEQTVKNHGICVPILKAEPEPWLDLVLIIDESQSMTLWEHTIQELQRLLKHYGIFREVRLCTLLWNEGSVPIKQKNTFQPPLKTENKKDVQQRVFLRSGVGKQQHFTNPKELIDPTSRRLILIVSDCVAPFWHNGSILPIVREWVKYQPLAIVQMLPDWMWRRTGLRLGASVLFKNLVPGNSNQNLIIKELLLWKDIELDQGIKIPVLTLEPQVAQAWSQMVVGKHDVVASGFVLPLEYKSKPENLPQNRVNQLNAEKRVHRFRMNASPVARKLAGLLSAAPMISLPIVRIIQASLLSQSKPQPVHVAEVFLGGLLKPKSDITPDLNSDQVEYQFVDEEIRQLFFKDAPISDSQRVFDAVSQYLQKHFGKSLYDFVALLKVPETQGETAPAFAEVAFALLKQLGGDYAEFAQKLENTVPIPDQNSQESIESDPDLKICDFFKVATIEILEPRTFEFTVATIKRETQRRLLGLLPGQEKWVIKRQKQQAEGIIEVIGEGIELELMEIPGGIFWMGAPEGEESSSDDEKPQHKVTAPSFYMGRYQVTQAQWKAIAERTALKVNIDLNPDPSRFQEDPPQPPLEKGEKAKTRWDRPVENVSWHQAKEFCDRLSKLTEQQYRLPTEAEWEYACRSQKPSEVRSQKREALRGTKQSEVRSEENQVRSQKEELTLAEWNEKYNQPFHFGETLSTELANYNGNYTYGDGVKGIYREQTTPVGYFKVANAFGLYDMHGNVYDWCEDDYHPNYNGAPIDGSAWIDNDNRSQNKDSTKIIRGGSWLLNPFNCRSANRIDSSHDYRYNSIGFRVVRSSPRTL